MKWTQATKVKSYTGPQQEEKIIVATSKLVTNVQFKFVQKKMFNLISINLLTKSALSIVDLLTNPRHFPPEDMYVSLFCTHTTYN